LRLSCEVRGLFGDRQAAGEVPVVEVEASRAREGEGDGARPRLGPREPPQLEQVRAPLGPPTLVAVDALERLMGLDSPRIVVCRELQHAVEVFVRQRRLVCAPGCASRREVVAHCGRARVALGEVAADDRGRQPFGQRRARQALAEESVHARAGVRLERVVGDVPRQRVA
jgi:hypothetical protein